MENGNEKVKNNSRQIESQNGQINLIPSGVDWTSFQSEPQFQNCLFVVSSTHTSLEGPIREVDYSNNRQLGKNQLTHSMWGFGAGQGERASLSTPVSTLYRVLTPRRDRLLFEPEKLLKLPIVDRKGERSSKNESKTQEENLLETKFQIDHDDIRICLHKNVKVFYKIDQPFDNKYRSTKRENWKVAKLIKVKREQLIHHAFCSSISLRKLFQKYKFDLNLISNSDSLEDLFKLIDKKIRRKKNRINIKKEIIRAKQIVECMVISIIKSAIILQSQTIILPFIGAGVYCNSKYWTIDALKKCIPLIVTHKLRVIVSYYTCDNSKKEQSNLLKMIKRFENLSIDVSKHIKTLNKKN